MFSRTDDVIQDFRVSKNVLVDIFLLKIFLIYYRHRTAFCLKFNIKMHITSKIFFQKDTPSLFCVFLFLPVSPVHVMKWKREKLSYNPERVSLYSHMRTTDWDSLYVTAINVVTSKNHFELFDFKLK